MTEATKVELKNSTRRDSKSRNDRYVLCKRKYLPKKKPESARSGFTRSKVTKSARSGFGLPIINAEVSQQKPNVRIIMRSGIVHANGRCSGKECSIPYTSVSTV